MTPEINHEQVLEFWLEEITPKHWWQKDVDLDRLTADRFGATHTAAACCELAHWRTVSGGRLAEIVVLDQFSRNIHRDTPQAFACDPLALALAQEAIDRGVQHELADAQQAFLYMPFMHSESPVIHEFALQLFREPAVAGNLEFELRHKAIIDRFGRYPHRNAILGRVSTPEELSFLQQPGSSF